jgi:hypothetical protein
MSTRYFTLEQAQGLLPEVSRLVHTARQSRISVERGGLDLARLVGRIEVMGGLDLDPSEQARQAFRRQNDFEALRATMEALELLGVRVTDLDSGAVDFPTRYRGAEACMSWKLGEGRIRYWRPVGAAPFVRKEIDDEFLSSHQGGPVH